MSIIYIDSEEMKNKISKYYDDYFDPSSLIELLNGHPFQYREFGYQSFSINQMKNDYGFYRNLNFDNPFHLIDWASRVKPRKLYLGAQYTKKIDRSIENTSWHSTDLKFDIDLDDSEEIRKKICSCRGKQMCNNCFEIAKEATAFLIEVLDQDFANPRFPCYKENAVIYLSGSKGTHIHYPKVDRVSENNTPQQEEEFRRFLINYIQMVSEPKRRNPTDPPVKILHKYITSKSLQHHFEKMIVRWFFQKIPSTDLVKLQWYSQKTVNKKGKKIKNDDAIVIFKQIKKELDEDNELILNKEKIELYGIFYPIFLKNVLWNRYPRFDGPITFDIKRIIKVPNSVDGSTGKIVQQIKYEDLFNIKLNDLLTIDHFI